MRYFLDTHVLLWWRADDARLPHHWDAPFDVSSADEVLFSQISLWEMAIKRSLGKLAFPGSLEDFAQSLVSNHGFRMVGLTLPDLDRLEKLDYHHRDPFDRLLIAQAIERKAMVVTNDPHWKAYPVTVEW